MYGTCIDACQMNIRKSCVIDVFLCPFDSWFCRNTSSTFCLHSSSSLPWSGSQCSSISLSLFTIYEGTLPRFTQTALHWDKYRYCANFCIHQKSRSKIKESHASVDSGLYFLIVFVATVLLVLIMHVISL